MKEFIMKRKELKKVSLIIGKLQSDKNYSLKEKEFNLVIKFIDYANQIPRSEMDPGIIPFINDLLKTIEDADKLKKWEKILCHYKAKF